MGRRFYKIRKRGSATIPNKLRPGDEIRVIAPSRSLSIIWENVFDRALECLTQHGFAVTFSKHSREMERNDSASVESRIEDLHEAFLDPNIKAVIAAIGGFNANQLLEGIDYSILKQNPKILCGFSDITVLLNAVYAKTGMVTYHGPHFTSFVGEEELAYTLQSFDDCLVKNAPYSVSPSCAAHAYKVLQQGTCEGKLVGGNLCTLNLLQGTPYMPDLNDAVLFLEDDNIVGNYFPFEFERNLQSLFQQSSLKGLKGLILGRFEESCGMDLQTVRQITEGKKQLRNIPVVCGVDFGHLSPLITLPIGGTACIEACSDRLSILISAH